MVSPGRGGTSEQRKRMLILKHAIRAAKKARGGGGEHAECLYMFLGFATAPLQELKEAGDSTSKATEPWNSLFDHSN